jgi:6-phosphogluconolactonase
MNGTVELVASVPDAFADLVAGTIAECRGGPFSLFLSGGATAQECYRRLAERTAPAQPGESRAGVDWTTVDVFLGDERCVPPDHPDSNHRMITEALVDVVGPVHGDHPMYRSGPPGEAAAAYQALVEPLGHLDLVHLGLGPDGHCASLFPGSAALELADPDVLVVANRDPNGGNPHGRITLTLAGIARARLVVFTVSGTSKHEAFARIMAGEDLPSARVVADRVLWLVDTAAAGDVGPPQPRPAARPVRG